MSDLTKLAAESGMDRADEIAAEIFSKYLHTYAAADLEKLIAEALRAERDRCHKIATHVEFPSGRHLTWQEIADRIDEKGLGGCTRR